MRVESAVLPETSLCRIHDLTKLRPYLSTVTMPWPTFGLVRKDWIRKGPTYLRFADLATVGFLKCIADDAFTKGMRKG